MNKKFQAWINSLQNNSVKVIRDFKIGPNEACTQRCLVSLRGMNTSDEQYEYIHKSDVYFIFQELEKSRDNGDDDFIGYGSLIDNINKAPMTYYPALLDETVKASIRKGVFKNNNPKTFLLKLIEQHNQ